MSAVGTLHELETALGYCFNDAALLQRALTHSSHAHEQKTSADNEQMKRNARENLLRLDALDQMDILRDFISKIEARLGRPVESIEELVKLGLIKQPLDPKGFTYVYNPQTRTVELSPDSTVRRF